MANGKKKKKRKLKNLSKTTKEVLRSGKKMTKRVKRGTAGGADAGGVGGLLTPRKGTGRGSVSYTGDVKGSGGNLVRPKKRKGRK